MVEARQRDPRALRALAHPGRLRLLEELAVVGPATATQLSERVGESPANCSWHLRQLARYGFVEEAGSGPGRQRPWQVAPGPHQLGDPTDGAEAGVAGDAVAELMVAREVEALMRWHHTRAGEPARWREAAELAVSWTWLTVEELAELNEHVGELLHRHAERADPQRRPAGARAVRLVAWGVPAGPADDVGEDRHDDRPRAGEQGDA